MWTQFLAGAVVLTAISVSAEPMRLSPPDPPAGAAPQAVPAPPPSELTFRPTRLATIVAQQLESPDQQMCSRDTLLLYESCLLYQGAFGYWAGIGFPAFCGEAPLIDAKGLSPQMLAAKALDAVSNTCFASLYAVAVVNAVPVLASTLNQLFHQTLRGSFENPGSDAERCLTVRYGLCGNHASLAQALFEEAGLPSRPVQFFYEIDGIRYSHIAPEVLIGGTYRFVDTTYGAYWTKEPRASRLALASLDEIREMRNPSARAIWNVALAPYTIRRAVAGFDPFSYLSAPKVSLIRAFQGTVLLNLRGPLGVERFRDLPDYLGDTQNDGQSKGLDFSISGARGRYEITLRTRATAVTNFAPASVCIDDMCQQAPVDAGELTFGVKDPRRLHIESDADAAYVLMESLSWKRLK